MSESLVIRPRSGTDRYSLTLRSHDLGGVDYTTVLMLDRTATEAVCRTAVDFLLGRPEDFPSHAGGHDADLKVEWNGTSADDGCCAVFVLTSAGETIPIAHVSASIADQMARTRQASWVGNCPILEPEFSALQKDAKAAELRAEADKLESEAAAIRNGTMNIFGRPVSGSPADYRNGPG